MQASILIPVKNEVRWIGPCLQAVYSQTGVSFEVIVVDSGSTDGTLEVLRQFPARLQLIPPEAFHHARTRNSAASLARGETLVFLGGDAVPTSQDWLRHLLAPLADPRVAAVYGRQVPREHASLERQAAFAEMYGDQPLRKHRDQARELGYRLYMFSTVTCAIRREIWQEYPFPDDLVVFEDIGFAKRVVDAGWAIVYEPAAAVRHSHDYTAWQLFRRFYDAGAIYGRIGIWRACRDTDHSLLRDGWRTVRRKLQRTGKERAGVLAGGLQRDAAKALGLWLGRRERWLPLCLKRRLSLFDIYRARSSPPLSVPALSRQSGGGEIAPGVAAGAPALPSAGPRGGRG